MKKYFIVLSMSVFCFSCGNQPEPAAVPVVASIMDTPDWTVGEKLVAKSDCFTCHKLNDASTGPSYAAVSEKYENTDANQQKLSAKVISGGMGVWGQIPMVPHPALSKEDATAMVKYVLLQKVAKKEKEAKDAKEVKK